MGVALVLLLPIGTVVAYFVARSLTPFPGQRLLTWVLLFLGFGPLLLSPVAFLAAFPKAILSFDTQGFMALIFSALAGMLFGAMAWWGSAIVEQKWLTTVVPTALAGAIAGWVVVEVKRRWPENVCSSWRRHFIYSAVASTTSALTYTGCLMIDTLGLSLRDAINVQQVVYVAAIGGILGMVISLWDQKDPKRP